ncbi:Aldehyde/histidinol dehydrogenase [Aspergillus similis]
MTTWVRGDKQPWYQKISFIGSTTTSMLALQSASKILKRVTLELGGNDPAIVLLDVNVDKVAEKVAFFAFLNSGQVNIYEPFKAALAKHVESYKLGNGAETGITHGPLQNGMQYNSIEPSSCYFIRPTIIDRPPENSRIVVEEPFGPIVPLLSWKDEEEVIERANNTTMGLGALVWSNNPAKAGEIGKRPEAGNVWINTHFDLSPLAPFGGHQESGIGTEWGSNGLKGFCNVQTFLNKDIVS